MSKKIRAIQTRTESSLRTRSTRSPANHADIRRLSCHLRRPYYSPAKPRRRPSSKSALLSHHRTSQPLLPWRLRAPPRKVRIFRPIALVLLHFLFGGGPKVGRRRRDGEERRGEATSWIDVYLLESVRPYARLARVDRPIRTWLLS